MHLPKYSLGVGDRFAHQGVAQLDAVIKAQRAGVTVAPVWNKSNREHTIVGTEPAGVRTEADTAVAQRGWKGPYFVDADHIGLKTVDRFVAASDFFTLDVADSIGVEPPPAQLADFIRRQGRFIGRLAIPGIDQPLAITRETVEATGRRFLVAVEEAGRIYRHLEKAKDADAFVTEVSMDETDSAQTPLELFLILAACAEQQIPIQTIAPRFTGRFNKGVNYVGDVEQFAREFREDLAVICFAIGHFGLPKELKLSVHSGSDKFSIYGPMRKALVEFDAGVHLKTAGTTWLEELIGLAMAGGDGLAIAKEVYRVAAGRFDELCAPYASVVDIRREALPSPETVAGWDAPTYAAALRHDENCPSYDPNLRQLLHVGYKVAAEMGRRYTEALEKHAAVIAQNVTDNLYQRHIRPLFLGE
jgi:tagaturonate epimerase